MFERAMLEFDTEEKESVYPLTTMKVVCLFNDRRLSQ